MEGGAYDSRLQLGLSSRKLRMWWVCLCGRQDICNSACYCNVSLMKCSVLSQSLVFINKRPWFIICVHWWCWCGRFEAEAAECRSTYVRPNLFIFRHSLTRRLFTAARSACRYTSARYFLQFRRDTIRDAVLTCAQKLTLVSLIYRTEPTTKKWKTEN